MNIKPLADRVIVKPAEVEEKTEGGLLLPDAAKEIPLTGVVLAVGSGTLHNGERIPLEVETGDIIFWSKHSGIDIDVSGVSYLVIPERDILAVYKKDNNNE